MDEKKIIKEKVEHLENENIESVKFVSPVLPFLIVAVSIFVAEATVMLLLSVIPDLSTAPKMIIDSLVLVVLVSPVLYFYIYRPLVLHINERKRADEKREKLIKDLQESLVKVKTLSGLLPICSSCKKIRDDKGYWEQIEKYIHDHSGADFTHGICPECMKILYPDYSKNKK